MDTLEVLERALAIAKDDPNWPAPGAFLGVFGTRRSQPGEIFSRVRDAVCTETYEQTGTCEDPGHTPGMEEARNAYDWARKELFGRPWTSSRAEEIRILESAIVLVSDAIERADCDCQCEHNCNCYPEGA
jgi:hypothetical protein